MKAQDLSVALGKSIKSIQYLIKQGMPIYERGTIGRGNGHTFSLKDIQEWMRNRKRKKKWRFGGPSHQRKHPLVVRQKRFLSKWWRVERKRQRRIVLKALGLSSHRGKPFRIKGSLEIQKAFARKLKATPRMARDELELQRDLTARLTDGYVRKRIRRTSGLPAKFIPQDLVEAKREHIRVHRAIRESK